MIQVSPAEINERWDTLSFELRDFILSAPFNETIKKICLENDVIGSVDFIQGLIDLRLEGFMNNERFVSEMSELIGTEKGKLVAEALLASIPDDVILTSPDVSMSPSFPEKTSAPELGMPEMGTSEKARPEADAITPSTKTLTAMGKAPSAETPPTQENRSPVKAQLKDTSVASSVVFSTPRLNNPEPVSVTPSVPVNTPRNPAPFILHQESEVQSVIESSPSASRFSPLRPEFYTPNLEEMREIKPSFAKLQFGSPDPVTSPTPINSEKNSEIKISQLPLSDKGPIPENNVVNLKDLPL